MVGDKVLLWPVPLLRKKKSLRQPIVLILKTVHLQQLKVMQSSKLGM